jgi:homogentisate 1,2-dioxygenase
MALQTSGQFGAMYAEMKPMCVGENQLTIMLESCWSLLFTNWALYDSEALAAEDIPESTWDLIPVCLSLTYYFVSRLTIYLQDRFGGNKEVIEYLKSIVRA